MSFDTSVLTGPGRVWFSTSMEPTQSQPVTDIIKELSYYSLYDIAEHARWSMSDIPWDDIDMDHVDENLISLVRGATFGELTTYTATQAFMELFSDDLDFTQWMSVWLYEETKHPHALAMWLSKVGHPLSADFLREGRIIAPMSKSKVEMLTFNIISEVVAAMNYTWTAKVMPEPVLRQILHNLGKDEMRHSVGFEHYCKKLILESDDPLRDRVKCLRATWAFLHSSDSVDHPVFMTVRQISSFADSQLIEKTKSVIREQITRRIAGVIGVDIPNPESVYEIYRQLKREHLESQRSAKS